MPGIFINNREISRNAAPYIIAELSANHNGSLERALETITMAYHAGADAVKLQTYTADTMTIDCDTEDFQIEGGLWDGYKLYDLYKWAQTPFEWHQAMFAHAGKTGITVFSTPFDETAVDLLEDLNAPAYKIASFEAIDLPLIRYVAQTKKPMIISTGMADFEEISEAVTAAREQGCTQLALLHCTSAYPVPFDESHVRMVPELADRFNVVAGLSDHTPGTVVPVAATALGACIIEKHVTLSRQDKGPDSAFSLEPDELKRLCQETKTAWQSLGEVSYTRRPVENESIKFRRSLYFIKDIKAGSMITEDNIGRIRPGFGLAPKYYSQLVGRVAKSDIKRGTPVSWDSIR